MFISLLVKVILSGISLLSAPIGIALSIASWTILYLLAHEAAHAIAAKALGYNVRVGLASDGYMLSPSIKVEGCVNGYRRLVILYAPYLINISMILLCRNPIPRLIALLTLPNVLLEDDRLRERLVVLAYAIEVVTILFAVYFAI